MNKKTLTMVLFIAFVGVFPFFASASTLYQQLGSSDNVSAYQTGIFDVDMNYPSGTIASGYADSVAFRISSNNTSAITQVEFLCYTDAAYTVGCTDWPTSTPSYGWGAWWVLSTTFHTDTTATTTYVVVSTSSPHIFYSDRFYRFTVAGTGDYVPYGDASGTYPNYFQLGEGLTPMIINLITPVDGTSTLDFSDGFFTGTFDLATSTVSTSSIVVTYSSDYDSVLYSTGSLFYDSTSTSDTSGFWSVDKTSILYDGSSTVFYARASLFNSSGSFVMQSPVTSFTVSSILPLPTNAVGCDSTSSLPVFCLSAGDTIGDIKQGLCMALSCVFVPTNSQSVSISNRLESIKSSVINKPPLGYFNLIFGIVNDVISATSTFSFTASIYNSFSSLISPLDVGLAGVLGLLFIVWLVKRLSDFTP